MEKSDLTAAEFNAFMAGRADAMRGHWEDQARQGCAPDECRRYAEECRQERDQYLAEVARQRPGKKR